MEKVLDRFLRYVKFDTQSAEESAVVPSTPGQLLLARQLAEELGALGIDSEATAQGFVYASIPASAGWEKVPALGLIAHLDTALEASGKNVRPSVVEWHGGAIELGSSGKKVVPLERMKGCHIVVTDGTTLLGADDKAGVAEIMTAAEYLVTGNVPHGPVKIAFTPDEEIGAGVAFFDTEKFGADYAFTSDGGTVGGFAYENFNAANAKVVIGGINVHPGDAKNKMRNALKTAMEFQALLPAAESPEYTEGYEGFYHLCGISGDQGETVLAYLLRDFTGEGLLKRKTMLQNAADFLNAKYGAGTVSVEIRDRYRNMGEIIGQYPFLLDAVRSAMTKAGMTPLARPIRGGTDGAQLSFRGLPCPNLCTGGYDVHGESEYAVVEEMEQCVTMLLELVGCAKSFSPKNSIPAIH